MGVLVAYFAWLADDAIAIESDIARARHSVTDAAYKTVFARLICILTANFAGGA